jgi:hypothetical protein
VAHPSLSAYDYVILHILAILCHDLFLLGSIANPELNPNRNTTRNTNNTAKVDVLSDTSKQWWVIRNAAGKDGKAPSTWLRIIEADAPEPGIAAGACCFDDATESSSFCIALFRQHTTRTN